MKAIKNIGLFIFLVGLIFFTSLLFTGKFKVTSGQFESTVKSKNIKSEWFINSLKMKVVDKEFDSQFELSSKIVEAIEASNTVHKKNNEWDKVIWDKPHSLSYDLLKPAGIGKIITNKGWYWFLTFGLGIIGALMFIIPDVILLGNPGIKNNGIYHHAATNKGWISMLAFVYLVGFYILLYFYPDFIVNWTYVLDPISQSLSGNLASQWFLYGFLYCTVMTVMAVRMYIKYRHNAYQIVRTTSVLFFQVAFAFIIPEILVRFNKPYFDFKNAFPLDYDFFFDWNINSLIANGNLGIFMLVWGIVLTLVIVPVMVYFYGKRWYCSWVCGCGGLAETLGDPYRQHSSKKLVAWKIERWLIHGVLVFALLMTAATLYTYFSGTDMILGIKTYDLQFYYGFLIGSVFSGVIGTGFYPIMGNRVWCRFGCPLAAYMGLVQRFKSRFRITTNGGQCISCGNCSTYCEQGIDVRAYAQKGENIVRSSCVGCGVCSAVCPRGVLKLENGPEDGRINPTEILLGNDVDLMELVNEK
ncbi:4Fe-4S binding protein [Lutibacter sp. Hel_I_33_5]|uniref:4Fe-4S binding protein n=1 Tax=Lutibacter sp. Hel_I_33_5 TaxID=1566289 RepID=UPI0011A37624|nr:4Fe-4S binding protein [Lutibacter sp. Hel_I_33_5]TVZ56821.1 4Fe-4S binding protein [Lutibacter sp. Hel_I_33_5]